MAEAWTVSRTANGINVLDENGLPVCTRVGLDDANLIASAPRLQEQVKLLREALAGMVELHDKLSKKINWEASFLDAEAIRLMNDKPIAARAALKATKET